MRTMYAPHVRCHAVSLLGSSLPQTEVSRQRRISRSTLLVWAQNRAPVDKYGGTDLCPRCEPVPEPPAPLTRTATCSGSPSEMAAPARSATRKRRCGGSAFANTSRDIIGLVTAALARLEIPWKSHVKHQPDVLSRRAPRSPARPPCPHGHLRRPQVLARSPAHTRVPPPLCDHAPLFPHTRGKAETFTITGSFQTRSGLLSLCAGTDGRQWLHHGHNLNTTREFGRGRE